MSTYSYAAITTRREQADPTHSFTDSPPGVSTYVDMLAALVPAEVLALHAAILSVTTKTVNATTEITEPGTLSWAFFGLIIFSVALYVVPRRMAHDWERLDLLRMLIPPLAFVGWTMLQRATAFDAIFPNAAEAPRTVAALFLVAILGWGATILARKADEVIPKQQKMEQKNETEVTQNSVRPKSSLIVSDFRVFRPGVSDVMASVLHREEAFVIEACFQLQGSEARSLTAQQSSYEMKVYANELAGNESKLLTTYSGNLVKDVLEYRAQTAAPGLSPGAYRLVTLVTLGAPNRLAGYYDGPVIQVNY